VLVAAAICPHPPLLVPELAAGAAAELDSQRAACADAVATLAEARPWMTFIVGADIGMRATSLAPWGAPVGMDVPEPLPLSLLVGSWLTSGTLRSFVVVDASLDPQDCAELGAELADAADRVALLVMGDGSARHDVKAPGYLDPAAGPFDQAIAAALLSADFPALAALDPQLAESLMVAGRAPWQVLAGAAASRSRPQTVLQEFAAPYGVGYHLAAWRWQD
jgi:hypothetical protein